MKKYILLTIVCAGALACGLTVFFILQFSSTSLEITLIDAGSKSWVFDSTIRLQDRVIRGFKSLSYTFRNIKTGRYTISISAPDYESREITADIHAGRNVLKQPVELRGYAISGLESISVFEEIIDKNLDLNIRLVNTAGEAISDHPCLPLRILMRISPQFADGKQRLYEQGMKLERGTPVFSGEAETQWNTDMTETYRYSGFVPLDRITATDAPYLVIDYLFLLPNPVKMSGEDIDAVVSTIAKTENLNTIREYLDTLKDRLSYYISIKPDIGNPFGEIL